MNRWFVRILVLLFLLTMIVPVLVGLYTDWRWFESVGYTSIFIKIILAKWALAGVFGLLFFIFLYGNILIARTLAPKYMVIDPQELGGRLRYQFQLVAQRYKISIDKYFNRLLIISAIVLSFGAAVSAAPAWEMVLKFLNSVPFGQSDPIFNRDFGYYVFNLPWLQYLRSWFYLSVILSIIVTGFVHLFDGAIRLRAGSQVFASHVKAHMSVLVGLLFTVVAFDYWLRRAELLYSSRGVAYGASYTDVNALLPALNILGVIAVICAAIMLINIKIRGWLLPVASVGLLAAASIIIGTLYPAIIQQYRVTPNEIERETPYIELNIKHTREAYGLNQIEEKEFPVEETLNAADLVANERTISNIRVWDWRPLKKTYAQIQGIRPYYVFNDVDVDRYMIDGKLTQVLLSPRELSQDELPVAAQTWLNRHLVYTHGYGLVMSGVSGFTSDGLPELMIKDVPPTEAPGLKITRPELYYSEVGSEYVFVNTGTKEFDYPEGDANKYSKYQGKGGVKINNLMDKLLFSIRFSSLKILLSDSITDASRVMYYRHIREIAGRIAPFLKYDNDPYLVIREDGSLYWILDAYTVSDKYPYSQPYDGTNNYIRNSIKVTIDPYNGSVNFYVIDDEDPVAKAYAKIFPGLLKPFSEMPGDLKDHIRYPVDIFKIQTDMYATYHMQDPQVFYNKEDLWNIPTEMFDQQEQKVEPYYVIMKLAGDPGVEFLLLTPYTPNSRLNMIAWMAARSDLPGYGKLLVYKFPKQKLVYGSMQIEARIDQDPTISEQLSLWNQRGSSVIRGNLLIIPIEKSLIYVEPLYLQAEQTQLPELKRVIVAFGSKVVMEPTLAEALTDIFGGQDQGAEKPPAKAGKAKEPKTGSDTVKQLIDKANQAYSDAITAQKDGDWTKYGQKLNELEGLLKELSKGE